MKKRAAKFREIPSLTTTRARLRAKQKPSPRWSYMYMLYITGRCMTHIFFFRSLKYLSLAINAAVAASWMLNCSLFPDRPWRDATSPRDERPARARTRLEGVRGRTGAEGPPWRTRGGRPRERTRRNDQNSRGGPIRGAEKDQGRTEGDASDIDTFRSEKVRLIFFLSRARSEVPPCDAYYSISYLNYPSSLILSALKKYKCAIKLSSHYWSVSRVDIVCRRTKRSSTNSRRATARSRFVTWENCSNSTRRLVGKLVPVPWRGRSHAWGTIETRCRAWEKAWSLSSGRKTPVRANYTFSTVYSQDRKYCSSPNRKLSLYNNFRSHTIRTFLAS